MKKSRQPISSKIDAQFPIARVRYCLDHNGLNTELQKKIEEYNKSLLKIKKTGAPQKPLQKDQEIKKTDYEQKLKLYDEYVSKEYQELQNVYSVLTLLKRLLELKNKEPKDDIVTEQNEIKNTLNDKAPIKKSDESPKDYKKRIEDFKPLGYKQYITNIDLDDKSSITKGINSIETEEYKNVKYFIEKNKISKQKVRFNNGGIVAVAIVSEFVIRSLAQNAVTKAMEMKTQNKTIYPDHFINQKALQSPLTALFAPLPTFKAITERQRRRRDYEIKVRNEKETRISDAKKRALALKQQYTSKLAPSFDNILSFEEEEVNNGYAIRIIVEQEEKKEEKKEDKKEEKKEDKKEEKEEEKPKEKEEEKKEDKKEEKKEDPKDTKDAKDTKAKKKEAQPKVHYLWKNIDGPLDDDTVDFTFYIKQIFDSIKQNDAPNMNCVRVSKSAKIVASNIVKDLLRMFCPLIRILLDFDHVKTVNDTMIMTIIKMLLARNYQSSNGVINWSEDHTIIFNEINEKIKKMAESHVKETPEAKDAHEDEQVNEQEDVEVDVNSL